MDAIYERFCNYLSCNAKILDMGCGSGRDSLHFKSAGYQITAIDGSYEMCKLASSFLGLPVENITFDQINYCNEFDGIWACSSLLHVPKSEIVNILHKIVRACKKNAIMYTCFKYGTSETIKDGCHYSCYDEMQLVNLIKEVESMSLVEMWKSYDVLRHRNAPQWINIIIQINKH